MTPKKMPWLILILALFLASCSGTARTEQAPTQTELMPTQEPTAQGEVTVQSSLQSTATQSATTETVSPTLALTYTPAPTSIQASQPTQPPTILSNPAAIIAQVEGANWFMLIGGSQMESWISAGDVAGVLADNTEYQMRRMT